MKNTNSVEVTVTLTIGEAHAIQAIVSALKFYGDERSAMRKIDAAIIKQLEQHKQQEAHA